MIATWMAGEATASATMAAVTTMIERAHVGRERPPHDEHCLGDDRDRRQLEPAHPARVGEVRGFGQQRKRDEDDRRREGEPQPADDAAEPSGPKRSDRDPELAAGRTGERLAEREEVGEARLIEPPAALDVLAAEVGDVGDRPAERRQAEAEGCTEDLGQRGTVLDARCQIAPTPDTCECDPQPDHDREQPGRDRGDPAHVAGDVGVLLGLAHGQRDGAAHDRIVIDGPLLPVARAALGLLGLPLLGDDLRLELGCARFLFGRQGRGLRGDRGRLGRLRGAGGSLERAALPGAAAAAGSFGHGFARALEGWMDAAAGWAVAPAAQDSTRRGPGTSAVRAAC